MARAIKIVVIDPIKLGADCANCPYAIDGKPVRPVFGVGPKTPKGILVGEGPGADEISSGVPFSGNTGEQLNEELVVAKLKRDSLFVVNATCCQPIDKTEGRQRLATNCCRPVLKAQLATLPKQTPVLAMGKWAVFGLTNKDKGVMNSRGFVRADGFGTLLNPLIITWHPTYAFFNNPYEWGAFTADLQRFYRLVTDTLKPAPRRLVHSATIDDVNALLKESNGVLSIDIETAPESPELPWTGKDPTRAKLRTMGMGLATWGLSFRWDTASEELKALTKQIIEDVNITKVTQNGIWFDHRVCARYGMRFQ